MVISNKLINTNLEILKHCFKKGQTSKLCNVEMESYCSRFSIFADFMLNFPYSHICTLGYEKIIV